MYDDQPDRVSIATSTTPHRIGVGVGAVLVLIAAASVATDSLSPQSASSSSASAGPGTAARPGPVAAPAKDTESPRPSAPSGGKAVLPDLVGRSLEEARVVARKAGFSLLAAYDAADRHRVPPAGSGWTVCAQTPLPGTHPAHVRVEFAAARLTEGCPD